MTLVLPGGGVLFQPTWHGVEFIYPVCGNRFRQDLTDPPVCTGPHPSLDEHLPAVMRRREPQAAVRFMP